MLQSWIFENGINKWDQLKKKVKNVKLQFPRELKTMLKHNKASYWKARETAQSLKGLSYKHEDVLKSLKSVLEEKNLNLKSQVDA